MPKDTVDCADLQDEWASEARWAHLSPAGRATPTMREAIAEKFELLLRRRSARQGASRTRGTIAVSDNSPPTGRVRRYRPEPAPQQLPQDHYPNGLRQVFAQLVPAKPYCADYLQNGVQIRHRDTALRKRHLQLNGPSLITWMIHDIDHAGAYSAHSDGNLPEPNVIMVNPENGRAHSAYLLATPVARHSASRIDPLRFYAAVERGVARRLEADRHYVGLIAKNPMHSDWRTEWRRDRPYTLPELADWLFPDDMRPDPSIETTFGAGRNVTVFDELRSIAYREVRHFKRDDAGFEAWRQRCLDLALGLNLQFPRAMNLAECRAIAKPVAKWTWLHFSEAQFSKIQSVRGARRAAQMWAGHVSAEKTRPWETDGISRRTWYRRKKAQSQSE